MFSGTKVAQSLAELEFSHVVWLPDSVLGTWEPAIAAHPALELIRVCREGEAWTIAAGLWLAGRQPLVLIQNTGLFESGDALRNVLFDMRMPLYALIGYRSYLVPQSTDTARRFTEPILATWGIDCVLLESDDSLPKLAEHVRRCRAAQTPGAALVAEGKM